MMGLWRGINNDGSGGYQASYAGGSDDDLLVSVTPVIVNGSRYCWRLVQRDQQTLLQLIPLAGSFFSKYNSGGYDMMWVICNLNVTYKYYLSYIGGSNNDLSR
jgi:hypothetical protein